MKYTRSEIITWSNLLSFVRLLMSIPAFILLYYIDQSYGYRIAVFILLLIAALTDFFDGYLARKLNEITEVGKIIDPLADKVVIGIVVLQLYLLGHIPAYYFFIVVARDILIFIGGMFVASRINKVLPSNMLGKITVFVIALYLLSVILEVNMHARLIHDLLLYVSTLLVFASLIGYIIRAKESLDWYKNESVQKY